MNGLNSPYLITERPLQVLPSLAIAIGLNEALFVQNLHWMLHESGKEKDGKLWVFKTYEDWHEAFPFWSVMTIRRIVSSLKERKLIITTDIYNKMGIDKTLWYTVDYAALNGLTTVDFNSPCVQNEQSQQRHVFNLNTPITYNKDLIKGQRTVGDEEAADLVAFFTAVSGRTPTRGNFEEDWRNTLISIAEKSQNPEEAKTIIEKALRFALNPGEGKRPYTVASPRSIVNIAVNMLDSARAGQPAVAGSAAKADGTGGYYV